MRNEHDDFEQKRRSLNRLRYSGSAGTAAVVAIWCVATQRWLAAAFMATLATGFFVWWLHESRKEEPGP